MSEDTEVQQFLGEDFFSDVFDDNDFFNFDFTETTCETENSYSLVDIKQEHIKHDGEEKCKPQQRYPIATNDIKRTYAKQYENGVNSHEYDTFLSAMRGFCTPDVLGVISHPRGNPQGVAYLELSGLDVLADYVFRSFTSAPDSMCFFHDTQIVGYENGSSLIVNKFSVSGSRLFTVTAETEGQKVPDPPSLRVLHSALEKKITSGTSDVTTKQTSSTKGKRKTEQTQQAEVVPNLQEGDAPLRDAIKQSVIFKGASNKYDRYKKQKVNTLGAYVNYKEFSETSLRVKSKADKSGSHNPSSPSSTLVEGYRDEEVMIAGSEVKFGFSELLPLPVKMHVVGVHKFHVNADDKVYKMEFIVAYR